VVRKASLPIAARRYRIGTFHKSRTSAKCSGKSRRRQLWTGVPALEQIADVSRELVDSMRRPFLGDRSHRDPARDLAQRNAAISPSKCFGGSEIEFHLVLVASRRNKN